MCIRDSYTYNDKGKLLLMERDLGVNGIVDNYTEYSYSGSELASEIKYSMYGSGEYEIIFGKIITQTVLQDRVIKRVASTNGIEVIVDHNSGIILEHYISPEGGYPYQSFESMTEFIKDSSGQLLKQFHYSENFDNLHSVQYYENQDYMVEIDLGGDGTIDEQVPYPDDDYYLPELNEYELWIDNNTKQVMSETTYEDGLITKSSYYYVYDDSWNVKFEKEDHGNDGILDSVIEYGEYQCF